jgi:hypothetical protein
LFAIGCPIENQEGGKPMETLFQELKRLTGEGPIAAEVEHARKAELRKEEARKAAALAEQRFQKTIRDIDSQLRGAAKTGEYQARFDISPDATRRIALSGPYELVDSIGEITETREGSNPKWNFVLRVRRHYESQGLKVKMFGYSSSYGQYRGGGGYHILLLWEDEQE